MWRWTRSSRKYRRMPQNHMEQKSRDEGYLMPARLEGRSMQVQTQTHERQDMFKRAESGKCHK